MLHFLLEYYYAFSAFRNAEELKQRVLSSNDILNDYGALTARLQLQVFLLVARFRYVNIVSCSYSFKRVFFRKFMNKYSCLI